MPDTGTTPSQMNQSATKFGLATTSLDEATHLLSNAYAPVKLRSGGRQFDLEVSGIACGGVTVYRTRSASGVTFESEPSFDGYNLATALSGGQVLDAGHPQEVAHATGTALAVDATTTRSVRFLPDLVFKGISLHTDLVHACLAEMIEAPVTQRIRFTPSVDAGAATVRSMLMLADALFVGMEGAAPLASAAGAAANLNAALARMMLSGIPNSYTERLRAGSPLVPAPRHVTRAIDYMKAHAGEPIEVADIARAAGTSPRSLQEGFRRFRSTTPMAYLRELRLRSVRADLLDPGMPATVMPIALRWGFSHMGMFSAYYRAAFGETPRETLARRAWV